MKKMVLLATLILMGFCLSGCFLRVHKLDIAQGNIITQADTDKLHIGMSEAEVKKMMGNPIASNIFSEDRLDYIYTFEPAYGDLSLKRLTCIFSHGRLVKILRD